MNLFGCKFCKTIKVKHEKELQIECSRKNFDSLLWATLTVFQVINPKSNSSLSVDCFIYAINGVAYFDVVS